jgi:hypothetical protein
MKGEVQRGCVMSGGFVRLKKKAHKRINPNEEPDKLEKRPFLVLGQDFLFMEADQCLVAYVTTVPPSRGDDRVHGELPAKDGISDQKCWVRCSQICTIFAGDVLEASENIYEEDELFKVKQALRFVLAL